MRKAILREELVQVAAVAVAIVKEIDESPSYWRDLALNSEKS